MLQTTHGSSALSSPEVSYSPLAVLYKTICSNQEARNSVRRKERNRSAITLQSATRSYLTRTRYLRMKQAAIIIQSYTRRHQAVVLLACLKRQEEAKRRENAARVIQCAYHGYVQFWRFQQKREATIMIQARWRGLLAKRQYSRLHWAVGVVGERYSAVRRGKEVRRAQEKMRWAVGIIQEHYLAWREGMQQCQVSIHTERETTKVDAHIQRRTVQKNLNRICVDHYIWFGTLIVPSVLPEAPSSCGISSEVVPAVV